MTLFWIAAAALSGAAAALMLSAGARAAAGAAADPAVAVHRRQLAEIDDLAELGLLAESERKAARAEAGRRLLAAAKGEVGGQDQGMGGRGAVLAFAALTPLAAVAIYLFVGAPGAADAPFAARVAAWRAGDPGLLDPPRIAAVLKAIAADNPSDPEPLRNLALARMASGDAFGAVSALRKAVALAPERADLWVQLGEAFVAQSEGEVGPDAKAAFREALKREPGSAVARYYVGRAAIAEGDVEAGLMLWRRLMGEMDAGDPRRAALAAEIAQVDRGGR